MKKQNVKMPSGLGDSFGIIGVLKSKDREYVMFKKDAFVSETPPNAFLIEATNDFVVFGFKGSLRRAYMLRKTAIRKLIEIMRRRSGVTIPNEI